MQLQESSPTFDKVSWNNHNGDSDRKKRQEVSYFRLGIRDFVYTVANERVAHNKCQIPKYFFHFVAYMYPRIEWMLWKTTALKSTSAVFVTVLFKQRYEFWYFNGKVQVHWKYRNKSLWARISWEHINHPLKRWIKLSCLWMKLQFRAS